MDDHNEVTMDTNVADALIHDMHLRKEDKGNLDIKTLDIVLHGS